MHNEDYDDPLATQTRDRTRAKGKSTTEAGGGVKSMRYAIRQSTGTGALSN